MPEAPPPPSGKKQATRARILRSAARAFRGRGIDGVGVAELMQAAGLTHGGFYAHFGSKADLVAAVADEAARDSLERLQQAITQRRAGRRPLTALLRSYLSAAHLAAPEDGCLMAALASELPRAAPAVRKVATERIEALLALIEAQLDEPRAAARRDRALATLSGMVGALVLARAVDDPALALRLLRATATQLDEPDAA